MNIISQQHHEYICVTSNFIFICKIEHAHVQYSNFALNNIGFIFSWDSVACPYLYFASLPSNRRLLIYHLIYLKLSYVPQALRLDLRLSPLTGLILGTFHLNYYRGPRLQFWLHFHEALLFANSDDFGSLCHLVYRFHPKKYHNVKQLVQLYVGEGGGQ